MHKVIFLDFYGTLVHEDDEIISKISNTIYSVALAECTPKEISRHWWRGFSAMCQTSFADRFQTQREIGILSLADTMRHFSADGNAEDLIQAQFEHWEKPSLYEDTLPFLNKWRSLPRLILSNIDKADVTAAVRYHGVQVNDILTSEDVRAYKPRPELFLEALKRCNANPENVIHIGDSYASDVRGAGALGIRTIWLNRLGKPLPEGPKPDHICGSLQEADAVLDRWITTAL